jgi:hypothetical protein
MTRAKQRVGDRATDGERDLVVVDGSNIATEGRSVPSLAQLNEAVLSFREEYPDVNVAVVVDATFGHRIDKSEVATFDEAVAHNELVAPPAGAVGRGDAFVLSIADKSHARILSNDSFQEFHGTHSWLFDEGRLIGGKPVPHVGWVFVNRVPVKGLVSRKARSAAVDKAPSRRSASPRASEPMPVPTAPPPGPGKPAKKGKQKQTVDEPVATAPAAVTVPRGGPVNELLPFLDFVQHHPVGSSVTGVVESYSSHGAYVTIGDLRGYVPLRLMANPPPRSAREAMRVGEAVTLVVESFAPARRNVDLALPGASDTRAEPEADTAKVRTPRKAKVAAATGTKPAPAKKTAAAKKGTAKKDAAKEQPAKEQPAKKQPAKKQAPKKRKAKQTEAAKAGATKGARKASPEEAAATASSSTNSSAPKSPRRTRKAPPAKPTPAAQKSRSTRTRKKSPTTS